MVVWRVRCCLFCHSGTSLEVRFYVCREVVSKDIINLKKKKSKILIFADLPLVFFIFVRADQFSHHELELPHPPARGDPQPLHVCREDLAHGPDRLPDRPYSRGRGVHLLRRAEQVCVQHGAARLRERLL